jgi:hypothetical protein
MVRLDSTPYQFERVLVVRLRRQKELNTLCHSKSNGLRDHSGQQSAISARSFFIFLCVVSAQVDELRRAL